LRAIFVSLFALRERAYALTTSGVDTTKKAEEVDAHAPYRGSRDFYAVISDEIHQVIEFFRSPAEAEAMLEAVLEDEPDWREILNVERVDLVTGREN
jgi:hypothetical protein